jgi:4-amino-4-deoxy-L-arabinose transferase-like glycosyltransferase
MKLEVGKKSRVDVIIVLILILATFLRIYNIGFQDAWLDEIHTLKESDPNLSFQEFYDVIFFREGISHFYFLIIRVLFDIVGQSIVYARLVSAIFGILSVFYFYKTAKKLFNQNAGYIAAFLLALNLLHIEYSQEARTYAVFTFFVILSVYRLTIFINKITLKNAIWLGIATGLVANAHSIGLLNIAVIYTTICFQFLIIKPRQEKFQFLKLSFVSGIITLLVFIPVYLTIIKVSQVNSFWVQAPNFYNIKQVFIDLSGKSNVFFYTNICLVLCFIALSVYYIFNKNENINNKKIKFNLFFLSLWFLFCSSILIIKSYNGTSLVLNRYFISILPSMILMGALAIAYINNKLFNFCFVILFSTYSMYFIFIKKNYYNTIAKAQFSTIAQEIMIKRPNAPVFSSWGWLMSYYINNENSRQTVTETTFDSHLIAVKNGSIPLESFWFMDGNSRPYNLSLENEGFLNENYVLKENIELYDTWAKYYETKHKVFSAEVSVIAPKDDNFTIYYTEDGTINFSEENAVWVAVEGKQRSQNVRFVLFQGKVPTNLRFDFGINKQQDYIILEQLILNYNNEMFKVKGSDFLNYFIENNTIKTEIDDEKGTIKFITDPKNFYTPFYYPQQSILNEVDKITDLN